MAWWLLPAHFVSAVPNAIVLFTLDRLGEARGIPFEKTAAAFAGASILARCVALWVIPLEFLAEKRKLLLALQVGFVVVLASLAGIARLQEPFFAIVGVAWVLLFLSGTHDAVLDGLYVSELTERAQIKYQIIVPLAYGAGNIAVVGFLRMWVAQLPGDRAEAWGWGYLVAAGVLGVLARLQSRRLPRPQRDEEPERGRVIAQWGEALRELASRPLVWKMLLVAAALRIPSSLTTDGLFALVEEVPWESVRQAGDMRGYQALSGFFGALLGMLWILRRGLEKVLVRGVWLLGAGSVVAAGAALASPHLDGTRLLLLACVAQAPLALGPIIAPLYAIQQLAPGRFSMSAYAFALAAGQLLTAPFSMLSDLCQEHFGFVAVFGLTTLLSAVLIWLAGNAPFVHHYRGEEDGE